MPDVPDFEAPYSPSKRQRLKALGDRLQQDWKGIAFPQGGTPWFDGEVMAELPPFDSAAVEYRPANAWWLNELCRFAYTPDHKEGVRPWTKFDRAPFLESSPFEEIHSLHKTGSHAAIYRCQTIDGAPATVLSFRGTGKFHQWLLNLSALPVPWDESSKRDKHDTAYVHQGFKLLFDRIWPLLDPLLRDQPRPLVITGHSLGGALAQMTAVKCRPTALYTFGSPRVGNAAFGESLRGFTHYRVVNHHDIITLLPHAVEKLAPYDFRHHGDLVHLRVDPDNWRPDSPISFLTRSFKSAHPPECVVDHTPSAYGRALLEAARANGVS